MRKLLLSCAILSFVSGVVSPVYAEAAATCATEKEKLALDVRILQSDLMVAALTCGQKDQYNKFVTKFKPALIKNGKELQGYFNRVYGKKAAGQLNSFITQVANDSSTRSTQSKAVEYCATSSELFTKTLALKKASDLKKLTDEAVYYSTRHGIDSCEGQQYASKEEAKQ